MGATRSTIPAATHAAGDTLHGFAIERVTPIDDIKALVYEARHERTGAQLVHVHCHDEENMFSVGFRTPPADSTGVAHILEHCVLAGSKQYPVKDAFNELSKRTLNTFLNAMTWPDRTIYPVCSAVRADYFNLARVYADLVFHPLLKETTFQQEGHHLSFTEPEDPTSELAISGVVYNEMKGAYSSPEGIVYREISRGLLPDTPYGVDSGGDPKVIPELTYEQFRAFHRTYYSPSNARFMLYGDVPLADNLAFVDEVLAPFDRIDVRSELPLQPAWPAPRSREIEYPIGDGDDPAGKTFVVVGWVAGETRNVLDSLLLGIALEALVGTSASPLYKALIDSGLGQDVFPGGPYEEELRQGVVHIGLRGSEPEHADSIERLILDTTARVVDEGLDPEIIEGAFHQIEFAGKEISPPFPIMLLVRANPSWYFDGDPKDGLAFSRLVEQTRAAWRAEPRVFETTLKRWLLDNPHRERLVVRPSTTLAAAEEAEFRERMAARKKALTDADKQEVMRQAAALQHEQETPDTPEAVATLPRLKIEDVPARVRTVPTATKTVAGTEWLRHDVFSNGIGYLSLAFDIRDLDDEWAPFVPMMSRATFGMGAAGQSYEAINKRIGLYTGGIGGSATAGRHVHSDESYEYFSVGAKVLPRNIGEMMQLLRDLLIEPDPRDTKRLKDLLQEAAARAVASLAPRGHMYAAARAAASLHRSFWRREQWEGISQVRHLRTLVKQADVAALVERIAQLQQRLFTRARVRVSVAGDEPIVDELMHGLEALLAQLPAGDPVAPSATTVPAGLPRDTGVVIPAQVQYVGQVLPVPSMADVDTAVALEMLSNVAKSEYLYKKLRVQGGAYGGFSLYGRDSGTFAMLSYRDPKLLETLRTYEGIVDFVKSDAFTDGAVDDVRIGAIGSADHLLAPGQTIDVARRRLWAGIDDDLRQRFYEGLKRVRAAEIRERALPHIERALADAPRAVLGAQAKLEAANESLSRKLELLRVD